MIAESRIDRFHDALTKIEPNILQTLTKIKQMGIPMAIISNSDTIDVMYWKKSPLYSYFCESVFSFQIGIMKPDPRIYTYLLSKLRIEPSLCLYVGDGGSDEIRTARYLGMKTVLVTHFNSLNANKKSDYKIDNFYELMDIVQKCFLNK